MLGLSGGMYNKRHDTPIRERRCATTGRADRLTGMPPTSSPPSWPAPAARRAWAPSPSLSGGALRPICRIAAYLGSKMELPTGVVADRRADPTSRIPSARVGPDCAGDACSISRFYGAR